MNREEGKESGVSPVIGVMLMIVVTIIIAAVVSAFAGGLVGDQKKVPVAQFEIRYYSHLDDEKATADGTFTVGGTSYNYLNGGPMLTVMMKSGEPIPTKDLKLVTYVTQSDGTVLKNEYSGGTTKGLQWDLPNGQHDYWGQTGNIIHPGEVYMAQGIYSLPAVLGNGVITSVNYAAVSKLSAGDMFEMDIVHTPTNEIICHQVVRVE